MSPLNVIQFPCAAVIFAAINRLVLTQDNTPILMRDGLMQRISIAVVLSGLCCPCCHANKSTCAAHATECCLLTW